MTPHSSQIHSSWQVFLGCRQAKHGLPWFSASCTWSPLQATSASLLWWFGSLLCTSPCTTSSLCSLSMIWGCLSLHSQLCLLPSASTTAMLVLMPAWFRCSSSTLSLLWNQAYCWQWASIVLWLFVTHYIMPLYSPTAASWLWAWASLPRASLLSCLSLSWWNDFPSARAMFYITRTASIQILWKWHVEMSMLTTSMGSLWSFSPMA